MKCSIECSIGEVIDKHTILKIKKSKTKDTTKLHNINTELQKLENQVKLCKQDDELFHQLLIINKRLWLMEDIIREKSSKKEYDKQFIHTAEQIHITNDQRYKVKKEINSKYNSEIIEEKIYKIISISDKDIKQLDYINQLYNESKYNEGYLLIQPLAEKYKTYCVRNMFINRLFIDHNTFTSTMNIADSFFNKILEIVENIDMFNKKNKENFIKLFNLSCLRDNKLDILYKFDFLNYTNHIFGPNIYPDSVGFIKKGDVDKKVLLYIGGGYGDKIMFLRFIPLICQKYKQHSFILLIEDRILWMLQSVFYSITNLFFLGLSNKHMVGKIKYDYHHNVTNLIKFLDITDLTQVPFIPYLKDIHLINNKQIITTILQSQKKKYVINWYGNYNAKNELDNRGISLENYETLFENSEILFVIVTQVISNKERKILNKYKNVKIIDNIDEGNAFKDTMYVLKHVDGLITIDTALAHLGGTMDINTYVLLTKYCEWRWGTASKTVWYPNITLIRQQEQGSWNNVIDELKCTLMT